MDIRTTKSPIEEAAEKPAPPAEKSRPQKRKSGSRLSGFFAILRRALTIVPIAAKTVFLLAVAGFLFSVFNYAYTSETFQLRTIQFQGCRQTDPKALDRLIRDSFPANTLTIDLRELQRRLENEAWIRRAEIRRILPSDLVVYLQERVPSVILELNGELVLSDEEGILLDRYGTNHGKLDVPVFKGLIGSSFEEYRQNQEANSERVRLGKKMLAELESGSPLYTRNISEVDLHDLTNVRLLLIDDTAEVFLGDRDFLKRFRLLVENTKQYQDLKAQYTEFASVDLRFDGQIIYRPRRFADRNPAVGVGPGSPQNP